MTKGITKLQWETYLDIQASGMTNMFAIGTVINLSGGILDKESVLDIMKNYSKYEDEWGGLDKD